MYVYEEEKKLLWCDEGQRMLLMIRDQVARCLKASGAVRMQEAISGVCGSSWTMLACVDRLVELGEIKEISQPDTPGQYRVFVSSMCR